LLCPLGRESVIRIDRVLKPGDSTQSIVSDAFQAGNVIQ
jgi:hypothetical protein